MPLTTSLLPVFDFNLVNNNLPRTLENDSYTQRRKDDCLELKMILEKGVCVYMCVCSSSSSSHIHVCTCMHVPHVHGGQRIICDSLLLCGSWGLNLGGKHLYPQSHLICSVGAFEDCCLGYHPRIKWSILRHARSYHKQEVSGSCNLRAVR